MRIITKGTIPSEKWYIAKCNHCGTKFEFQQKEGTLTYDQRDGNFITIACPLPECNHNVTVSQ